MNYSSEIRASNVQMAKCYPLRNKCSFPWPVPGAELEQAWILTANAFGWNSLASLLRPMNELARKGV